MDVQAISQLLKNKTGANAATGGEDTPSNAFSALLQSLGARFTATMDANKLETKLLDNSELASNTRVADVRETNNVRKDDDKDVAHGHSSWKASTKRR